MTFVNQQGKMGRRGILKWSGCLLGGMAARHSDWVLGADDASDLRGAVIAALRKAGEVFRNQAASHGGYVYYYSPDFSERWGEGRATSDQVWVQAPGTPTVGLAFMRAFAATSDQWFLEAAREAATALLHGQLESGGWTHAVDFNLKGSQVARYRNGKGATKGRNFSTLDDGITPGALRFLLRLEKADPEGVNRLKTAIDTALDALLAAQFANGGFPQGWERAVEPRPVVKAQYPDYDWRSDNRIKNYWEHYTLNDGVCGHVAALLEDAVRLRGDARCRTALTRLGDFLLLAQMPQPQPAWAQQYDPQMRPIWARKFEPPAIAGRESGDALLTLIRIARLTRDACYLAPVAPARTWMEKSLLPNRKLARYYELRTNRPLYMTEDYQLTYDANQAPRHYAWETDSPIAEIEAAMQSLHSGSDGASTVAAPQADELRAALEGLDPEGRWLSYYQGERLVGQPKFRPGQAYVSSAVFAANVELLARYLKPGIGD